MSRFIQKLYSKFPTNIPKPPPLSPKAQENPKTTQVKQTMAMEATDIIIVLMTLVSRTKPDRLS